MPRDLLRHLLLGLMLLVLAAAVEAGTGGKGKAAALSSAGNVNLALAIGYPEIFSISQTTLNQAGRAVEILLMLTVAFLMLNAITSFIMNRINAAVQFSER